MDCCCEAIAAAFGGYGFPLKPAFIDRVFSICNKNVTFAVKSII